MSAPDPFTHEVVGQIMRHMNDDHPDDSLLIVRALGGHRGATAARMSGMDADGIDFAATVDGVETAVRLPWTERLTERAQVRREVVAMHERARAALEAR
jgi:putative heme iron utilization protein